MLALSAILTLLFLCYLVVEFVKLQRKRQQHPPGPAPIPILGCLWQLKFFRLDRDILTEVAKSHGDIFTLWFGQVPVIILNGFQAVKDGLTTHPEDVAGRPVTPFFQAMANNKVASGIFLATGRTWRNQRRFSLMTLKRLGLGKMNLEYQIQEEARHLVETFMNAKGKPMNPSFALKLAVSNVICAVVFGHRFSNDDKTFHHLLEAVEFIFKFAGSLYYRLYDVFPWVMRCVPGPPKKTLSCCESVCSFIRKEISIHQSRGTSEEPADFIHCYLAQIEKSKDQLKPAYDEHNMIQSIFDLFLAGTETSSTTLCWALLYMVAYPDVQAKVQKEIDATVAPRQMICYEDRKNLPYTNAVIHEVQRFSTIISIGVSRLSVKDTMIRQFPIKKGIIILPNIASALMDPNEWETPREFNPSHFLDRDGKFTCREAFIPFSIGHRMCLGEHLARVELFIFFSNLLKAFTFHLPEGVKEINTEPIWGGTLQPHYFEICTKPR
ncbi:cytochrome P450 2J4-like [Eublepharis macularius]|uniref:Cytochrome P450 2J4-like n=1 Tax=Eublepharis macularius TaxID=481883 RepID=A0AA97JIK5_EUBMA|nr:cytochrome P450 2J4-like [Eublepharis macularius]